MVETGAISRLNVLSNKQKLLLLGEILDFPFPFARLRTGFRYFLVHQRYRAPWASVFCTIFGVVMFEQASFQVSGNPCIQGIVGTADDINAPVLTVRLAHVASQIPARLLSGLFFCLVKYIVLRGVGCAQTICYRELSIFVNRDTGRRIRLMILLRHRIKTL